MNRLTALCFTAALLSTAPASAQQFEAAVDLGAAIPLSSTLGDILDPGIHVSVGFYYEVISNLDVGLQVSYDSLFGKEATAGFEHTGQWTGISAKVQYGMGDFFRWWVGLGAGFYFGSLSSCAGGCVTNSEKFFGLDLNAGVGWTVFQGVTIGPNLGVFTPRVGEIGNQLVLDASLRAMFNF